MQNTCTQKKTSDRPLVEQSGRGVQRKQEKPPNHTEIAACGHGAGERLARGSRTSLTRNKYEADWILR
ncbi:hypothetical protein [Calothrix sp. 336/3]|uniref:hypothetical protein n=1 Tax=Calothrix sp. 336/3 TaxID=1337936 RepID=UPI001187643A